LRHFVNVKLEKTKVRKKRKNMKQTKGWMMKDRCWVTRVSKHHFRDVNGASIMHPSIVTVEAQSDREKSLTSW